MQSSLRKIAFIFFFISCNFSHAQEIRSYYITCNTDEFQGLIDRPEIERYIDCTFRYADYEFDDTSIRIRGESSREYPKKSFKVNFRSGNRFFGRDKINLISEWTDPTFAREFLAYDLYRKAGIPAPEALYARLYINGEYMGLYLDVEQIDDQFLDYRQDFSSNSAIYKAANNGCFMRLDDDFNNAWEKKLKEDDGFDDLINLIKWLAYVPDSLLVNGLSERFDLTLLTRMIALNAIIGNQSTYYHNYYLVHDYDTGLWHWLPWDLDKTFSFWHYYQNPQYYRSGHQLFENVNKLVARCWLHPQIRTSIKNDIQWLKESFINDEYFITMTDSLHDLLFQAVDEDTYKNYSTEEFTDGLQGLRERIIARRNSVETRLREDPLPFDLDEAKLTPGGINLEWYDTYVENGEDFYWELIISPESTFDSDVKVISNLGLNRLVLEDFEPGKFYWYVNAISSSGRRVRSISYFKTFTIPEDYWTGTLVPPVLSTNQTWTKSGSPYRLPEGLIIPPNRVLRIEKGVTVGIGSERSIWVLGGLNVSGIEQDSVQFIPLEPGTFWGSINPKESTDSVTFSHSVFLNGGKGPDGEFENRVFQPSWVDFSMNDCRISNAYLEGKAFLFISSNIHLENVQVSDFSSAVIMAIGGNSIVIRSCNFINSATDTDHSDMIDISSTYGEVEISNCNFYFGLDDAIDLDGNYGTIIIQRNHITGMGDHGISIGDTTSKVLIYNNFISRCNGAGVNVKRGASADIYNNVLENNRYGIRRENPLSIEDGKVYVKNCIFWENISDLDNIPGMHLDVSHCYSETSPLPGEGNISSGLYANSPHSGDFRLNSFSALIDAGWGTDYPLKDYNFAPRVDDPGSANSGSGEITYVDIGMFEYSSNPEIIDSEEKLYIQIYPNPFNNIAHINFPVVEESWAIVEIYNILGQRIFQRSFDRISVGRHNIIWSSEASHQYYGSGTYFFRVRQSNFEKTAKFVLVH